MRNYRSESESETSFDAGNTSASKAQAPNEAYEQYIDDYEKRNGAADASFTEQTIDDEYKTYVSSVPNPKRQAKLDPLKFWEVSTFMIVRCCCLLADANQNLKTNSETFPTIFRMALDYLPIQASSVPCERVFSSSSETDTNKRNRIKPKLMEALQLLKYGYKKERLTFTKHLLTAEEDLIGDSPDLVGKDTLAEHLMKQGTKSHASTDDLLWVD